MWLGSHEVKPPCIALSEGAGGKPGGLKMMVEIVVRGGEVMLQSGLLKVDVGIKDGRIAVIAEPGTGLQGPEVIDATGLLVLPGTIDAHFHCRAPSHPERETFATGT